MAVASAVSTGEQEEAFVLPRAPLPEIIVSNVPGSWAYDTMVSSVPIALVHVYCVYLYQYRALVTVHAVLVQKDGPLALRRISRG